MGHVEVDFLPVGESERSADAIALRYGDFSHPSTQSVVVIDGGTKEAGSSLVHHIKSHYETTRVDLVVSTHPDADHSSGLSVIMEQMDVEALLMHRPWLYSEDMANAMFGNRATYQSIPQRLRRSLENVQELEAIAQRNGIPMLDPFTDLNPQLWKLAPQLTILGPSREFYLEQLPAFRAIDSGTVPGLMSRAGAALAEAIGKVGESLGLETLTDPPDDATSAENNTSVILHLDVHGYRWLFTGDAGVPALAAVADYADLLNLNLRDVRNIQVPHHGSRRNVGPSILNRIVGVKRTDKRHPKVAVVSASKGDSKHPSKKVANAFYRRGARVTSTQQVNGYLRYAAPGTPPRPGTVTVDPLPFYHEVEEGQANAAETWNQDSTYMPSRRDSARRY